MTTKKPLSHQNGKKHGMVSYVVGDLWLWLLCRILVPRAAILLASATDRELWQEPILRSPRFADFRSTAQPQGLENEEWSEKDY